MTFFRAFTTLLATAGGIVLLGVVFLHLLLSSLFSVFAGWIWFLKLCGF